MEIDALQQPSSGPGMAPGEAASSAGSEAAATAAAAAAAATAAAQNQGSATTQAAAAAQAAAQAASHLSFRRQRASRACETCHARKVRCDAASLGVPCTNCVAFNIECRIPTPKRKKVVSQSTTPATGTAGSTLKDSDSDRGDGSEEKSPRSGSVAASTTSGPASVSATPSVSRPSVHHTSEGTPSSAVTELQAKKQEVDAGTFVNILMKPRFTRAPITEPGRVAYLGESSNLTLLVHDQAGSADVVHYPLPENVRGSRARLTELDNVEIEILQQRGAFLLPPRELCDELIDSYFIWIHPIMPVINRNRFMRQYRDPDNPPSLLLLQAILLAGSRVCNNPKLMDANGSTTPAALTFYKRAKALYDANYEDDRVTIVQSLLLMGWYWEGPEDVTKNVFYWSRVATIVAQGSGMHRSVEGSQLSLADKRLWKRIWWTLFTRDRSVAVALGRPIHINLEDSDVEMLTEDDFIEDEPDLPSEFEPDPLHVQFFLQYVKLCEIMGLVLSQQYSVASKGRQKSPIDLTHSDMALADWLQNCPRIVCWYIQGRSFWSALLFSNYYTTLCLLHRAYMPPGSGSQRLAEDHTAYPSRNIAFHAAGAITSIIEYLAASGELKYCPAFIVYSLFSALIMHVYQLRSPVPSIQQATQENLRTCMGALKEVSKVWLVGKMVHALFESILGNKVFEERLRKAGGVRHRKAQVSLAKLDNHASQQKSQSAFHQQQQQQQQLQDISKRKYDEMAIDFSVNTPQPQESYERSRPQTPSHLSASKVDQTNAAMGPPSMNSGGPRPAMDAFAGGSGGGGGNGSTSRPQTRPHTPFPATFSLPTTPPDLYLVTRNSPNLSQSVWENFQPDQLFPDSTGFSTMFPQTMSPTPSSQNIDANIMAPMQQQQQQQQQQQKQPHISPSASTKTGAGASPMSPPGAASHGLNGFQGQQGQQAQQAQRGPQHQHQHQHQQHHTNGNSAMWPSPFDGTLPDGQSPSDSWSTGSVQGQPVPSTLNVEDWFQFFGINGDSNGINLDLSTI